MSYGDLMRRECLQLASADAADEWRGGERCHAAAQLDAGGGREVTHQPSRGGSLIFKILTMQIRAFYMYYG